MNGMFDYCKNLVDASYLKNWNTVSLKSIGDYGMFYSCTSLQTLDMSGWNVSNINKTTDFLDNCNALKT